MIRVVCCRTAPLGCPEGTFRKYELLIDGIRLIEFDDLESGGESAMGGVGGSGRPDRMSAYGGPLSILDILYPDGKNDGHYGGGGGGSAPSAGERRRRAAPLLPPPPPPGRGSR